MKNALILAVAFTSLISQAPAQDTGSSSSSSSAPQSTGAPASGNAASGNAAAVQGRSVSWPQLFPNIAQDQKQIWTYPLRLTHDDNWIPFVGVVAATAALVGTDQWTDRPFRSSTKFFQGFNSTFKGSYMSYGIIAAPASMYIVGLASKDKYAQDTALFIGEAVADSEILTTVLKTADRRARPREIPKGGNLADTWFESPEKIGVGHGSFPSGHTIAAFSVATIIARRYGAHRRWVPLAAYGLAALVGFSRLTTLAHFPSDVFLGAALGYSIGRFSVLR